MKHRCTQGRPSAVKLGFNMYGSVILFMRPPFLPFPKRADHATTAGRVPRTAEMGGHLCRRPRVHLGARRSPTLARRCPGRQFPAAAARHIIPAKHPAACSIMPRFSFHTNRIAPQAHFVKAQRHTTIPDISNHAINLFAPTVPRVIRCHAFDAFRPL